MKELGSVEGGHAWGTEPWGGGGGGADLRHRWLLTKNMRTNEIIGSHLGVGDMRRRRSSGFANDMLRSPPTNLLVNISKPHLN